MLTLFSLANLIIGTGAFVVSGILAPIASDLRTSVPAAGQTTTVYALSAALLAPAMLVAANTLSRRGALLLALSLFAIGNLVCAVAPNLLLLLIGRVIMGVGALFTPIAATIAVELDEPASRGRSLAYVFLGISLTYVVGVPFGMWLGFGFGWRVPIMIVCVATLVMLALIAWRMPQSSQAPVASFKGIGTVFRRGDVIRPLLLTLLYFSGTFCVFAYIGPVLKALDPSLGPERLSITLALFGVGGAVGTMVGGWANDRFGSHRTLVAQFGLVAAMLALVPLTGGAYALTLAALILWGIAGFGMMAPQQARLAEAAGTFTPLALSLNSSMLYGGAALGAAVGGAASGTLGFDRLAWVGLPFALAGLATLLPRRAPRVGHGRQRLS